MFYVGLDIHTTHTTICILDGNGKVDSRCQVRRVDQMMAVLERLPEPFEVCYEASTGYGRFFELLTPIAARVAVAHPGLLRLIFRSKNKNDRRDGQSVPGTGSARRPRTQEEGGGGDGSLSGPRDVGHDEKRHFVERDACGAKRDGCGTSGLTFPPTSPTKGQPPGSFQQQRQQVVSR